MVQRWLDRTALVEVAVFGHVGATPFVMSMAITALHRQIAHFSITVKPDVGVSYGMAAVIGLLAARVPHQWRSPARSWPADPTSRRWVTAPRS